MISLKYKESGEFIMVKVGEHITLDIIGTKKEYSPSFFEKLIYPFRCPGFEISIPIELLFNNLSLPIIKNCS